MLCICVVGAEFFMVRYAIVLVDDWCNAMASNAKLCITVLVSAIAKWIAEVVLNSIGRCNDNAYEAVW